MPVKNPVKSQSKANHTILWWVAWITLTIVSFFVASSFWTPLIAKHFGSVRETKTAIIWVAAVFGTWIVFLVPLIILMYSKVDKVYEDARLMREKKERSFRSMTVPSARRTLRPALAEKIASWPADIDGGHLVQITLADGRKIENVFVAHGNEILGIYNASEMNFNAGDVMAVEAVDWNSPPKFIPQLWLRLDGIQPE